MPKRYAFSTSTIVYIRQQAIIKAFESCKFHDQVTDGFYNFCKARNNENLQIISGKFYNSGKFENNVIYDVKQI